jgi:hypothetical protein
MPTGSPSFLMAQANFEPNLLPYYTPSFLKLSSFYTHLPAYEDGKDRVLRNIGIYNSDAGELPRRKHTTFRTRRKFEIKKRKAVVSVIISDHYHLCVLNISGNRTENSVF